MVVEPLVQGAAGMIVHPEGICGTARVVPRYGVLLIADEVAVGSAAPAPCSPASRKVTPDFLCVAKGLTGGYLPWPPP